MTPRGALKALGDAGQVLIVQCCWQRFFWAHHVSMFDTVDRSPCRWPQAKHKVQNIAVATWFMPMRRNLR